MSQDDVDGWVLIQPGVNVPINTPGVEYKFGGGQVTRDGMRAFEYSEQLIAYRIVPSAALSAMPQRELLAEALEHDKGEPKP